MAQTTFPGTTDRRIDALLALLSDNAMIVISGAKIAREIGVTRAAPCGAGSKNCARWAFA